MEYISLPTNLYVIIGIASYYCVIPKMVILHDAIKTIRMGFLCVFIKNKKLFLFKKTNKFGLKQQEFFFKTGFSQP